MAFPVRVPVMLGAKRTIFPMKIAKISFAVALSCGLFSCLPARAAVRGWLNWRGPQQNGTSTEKSLPDKIDAKAPLWMNNYPGASTPVVANGKVYVMCYLGEGPDLQEGVACFDAE